MNQILITQKLIVTPELKKKKKLYKFNFMLSIFSIIVLFSAYIYAEYDRNKNEEISQEILSNVEIANVNDDTTIDEESPVWIFVLDATKNAIVNVDEVERNVQQEIEQQKQQKQKQQQQQQSNNESQSNELIGIYTAPNGKQYNTVGTVIIPSLGVEYPILSETTDALLKVSVCKFWGCEPNEVGNLCIAGHNYRNKRFFSKVPNLSSGDIIQIKDLSGKTINYTIYDKYTVEPTDVSCTSQITNGKKIVTLITCTNDSKQRVVVKAVEK